MATVVPALLPLPDDPSLEQLRNQARELQRGVRAGDPEALELLAGTLRDATPGPAERARFQLSSAHLALARAYGFASWPKLRAHLDVIARWRWDPLPEPPAVRDGDVHDRFLDLACLVYDHDDSPARRAAARALLAADPALGGRSVWTAAVTSDPVALAAHLAADPSCAVRSGGPLGWEPIMYLTYSRLDPGIGPDAVLDCARLLLDAGADPDTGRLWRGLTTPFTLLTGCFGEGENGPGNQPRHPHSIALARLLLEAGADPDDGQTLYNRMFRADEDHLELLFTYGLGLGRAGLRRPWRARLGSALETTEQMLDRQLGWAIRHGFTERVRLLLAHGIDPSRPLPGGRTPVQAAQAVGNRELVALLGAAGARVPRLRGTAALTEAALAGDRATVNALVAGDPDLATRLLSAKPDLVARACAGGRIGALPLLIELGFSVDARSGGATALHHAAWAGDEEMVRALLALGADPDIGDDRFDATPRGWAEHAGHERTAALLPDPGRVSTRAVRRPGSP